MVRTKSLSLLSRHVTRCEHGFLLTGKNRLSACTSCSLGEGTCPTLFVYRRMLVTIFAQRSALMLPTCLFPPDWTRSTEPRPAAPCKTVLVPNKANLYLPRTDLSVRPWFCIHRKRRFGIAVQTRERDGLNSRPI
jgi:hypothetical protein